MNTGGDYTTHHSNENVIGPEMHDSNGDDEDDLESQYSGFLDTYTKLLPHHPTSDSDVSVSDDEGLRTPVLLSVSDQVPDTRSESINVFFQQTQFSRFKRWRILLVSALPLFLVPLVGTMYLPALPDIEADLRATQAEVAWSISSYAFAAGTAPLVFGPVADVYGRYVPFLVANLLFVGSVFMCAGSIDIWMLIVVRIVLGTSVAGFGVLSMGTVADIFAPKERGKAMGILMLPALVGPIIGPPLGGVMAEYLGWRSIFYLLITLSLIISAIYIFTQPETLVSVVLEKRKSGAKKSKLLSSQAKYTDNPVLSLKETPNEAVHGGLEDDVPFATLTSSTETRYYGSTSDSPRLQHSANAIDTKAKRKSLNPLLPLKLMANPYIAFSVFARAMNFSTVYIIMWSMPIVVSSTYNQDSFTAGLLLVPFGLGTVVGSPVGGKASDICGRLLGSGGRLIPFVAAGLLTIIGCLGYGYFIESIEWLAICFSCIPGFAMTLGRPGVYSFSIEMSPRNASSIIAVHTTGKFVVMTIAVGIAPFFLDNLGPGNTMAVYCGCLVISLLPLGFVMFKTIKIPKRHSEYECAVN